MPFQSKDYRQIRADILRDIANQRPDAYTGDDSDFAVRANAVASSIEGLYEHQQWITRQIFPDTADADILETKHANPRGITIKDAAFATGTVRFPGVAGSVMPIGTESKTTTGIAIITTASGVVGVGGTVDVAAKAVVAGLLGNLAVNTPLTLTAAPAGFQSQATIVSMTGGTDIETPEELLARVLFYMRMPPMGGAKHDYYAWAMEVPGVTDAYIFTQRRAVNSVDVVIETTGGLPSAQLIADVQAYILRKCPLCVDLLVMAPTLLPVNISAVLTLLGINLADATARITALLQAYFATLIVGEVVTRAKLISLMMSVKGVVDVNLTTPAANAVPLGDVTHSELASLGTVGLT
jgi:uncharacterized phage protein gp47/JayE